LYTLKIPFYGDLQSLYNFIPFTSINEEIEQYEKISINNLRVDRRGCDMGAIMVVVFLAVLVMLIAATWRIHTKAGKPGWACLVPIYNLIVMLEIIKRPVWWIVLLFVPIANLVVAFMMAMDIAECFGKSRGWGFFMLTILAIIGYPIIGLSDAKYTAPAR